ncbi:hypothetical protein ASE01_12130 [Nocardioides sp. Root190]|uniref:hypothetical protein n=1 Tax=Nocardioides sp. Root190 TaxID=1736488 RepID=UPI0006FC38EB|nr:hypothetical protein [Nocardioides sp. Root190]KRB75803.1 hypothetical protein ASE01_12130 [Nocardioides sp. Root190]
MPHELVCTGTCAPKADEAAARVLGFDVQVRPLVQIAPNSTAELPQGTCGKCKLHTTTEACPYCRYEIPALWRQSRVTTIAMAGARTTGKSLLVATGVMQLHLLAERQWHSAVEPLGSTAARFRAIYEEPLLEQRRLMPATDGMNSATSAGREPLMFRMTQRINGEVLPRILVLKDVAGEDLENSAVNRQQFSFLSRANAVFLMVDPLKVAEIRAVLADAIPSAQALGGDPLVVLNLVLGHMTGHIPGAMTDIPVALVLSKFDVMQRLRDVSNPRWSGIMSRAGSPLVRDPGLATPVWDAHDGDLLHEEVRTLLIELGVPLIEATLKDRTRHHRYFAASALGESPDDKMINPRGIAPFRVLDAFKWAMSFT